MLISWVLVAQCVGCAGWTCVGICVCFYILCEYDVWLFCDVLEV